MQRTMQSFLIPWLADLIGLGLAFLLLPLVAAQLETLGFFNSVLLGVIFVLFCLAVYALKKLAPAGNASTLAALVRQKRLLAALGVFFALNFTLVIAYAAGFLDSVVGINRFLLDEPAVTIYLLLTPASWFGLALIYMLLLSTETEPTVDPESGLYLLLALLGLTGVNLMAVVFSGVAGDFWARFNLPAGGWLVGGLTFLLYLLLFGPPRLLYQAKQLRPGWVGFLTFLPLLLYLAWLVVG